MITFQISDLSIHQMISPLKKGVYFFENIDFIFLLFLSMSKLVCGQISLMSPRDYNQKTKHLQ